MARRPAGRAAAGAVLPCRLHAAGAGRRDRVPEQGRGLRHPVQGRGRDAAHDRRRSEASRRRDRHRRRAAHLGPEPASSSARPLRRAGRRPVARRHALDRLPARLLPAGARAVAALPSAVPRRACEPRSRPASCASSAISPSSPSRPPSPDASPQLRRIEWVVYAKPPFGGPEQVLAYLGRYTHRVAIANSRLVSMTDGQRQLPLEGLSSSRQGEGHDARRPTSSSGASCCTPCRTASTASATTASSPTAIAPRSSRSAASCWPFASAERASCAGSGRHHRGHARSLSGCGGAMITLDTLPRPQPRVHPSGTTAHEPPAFFRARQFPTPTPHALRPASLGPAMRHRTPAPHVTAINYRAASFQSPLRPSSRRRQPIAARIAARGTSRPACLGPGRTATIPIARPPSRGFVQSGFNEVALLDVPNTQLSRDLTEASRFPNQVEFDSRFSVSEGGPRWGRPYSQDLRDRLRELPIGGKLA